MGFGGLHFGSLFLEKSNCNFHFFADQQYFRPSNDSEKLNNLSVVTQQILIKVRKNHEKSFWWMRKCSKSHGHYNGVMLQFLGSSSIMYWGSNRKSGSLSQKLGSPPYFYFGLATSAPWTPVFAVFWPVDKRLEMLFIRKSGVSVVKSKSVAKTRTGSSFSPHFGLRSKVAQKCS